MFSLPLEDHNLVFHIHHIQIYQCSKQEYYHNHRHFCSNYDSIYLGHQTIFLVQVYSKLNTHRQMLSDLLILHTFLQGLDILWMCFGWAALLWFLCSLLQIPTFYCYIYQYLQVLGYLNKSIALHICIGLQWVCWVGLWRFLWGALLLLFLAFLLQLCWGSPHHRYSNSLFHSLSLRSLVHL